MEALLTYEGIVALITLCFLEIVLGIDNLIFISILTNKLPPSKQPKARNIGLSLAMIIRIAFLFMLTWLMGLNKPFFYISNYAFSGKDLVLFIGGLFLVAKATSEIYEKIEGNPEKKMESKIVVSLSRIILQIVLLDIVFSLDSILTAIGLVEQIELMIIAIVVSMIVMMLFSGKISKIIHAYPSLQVLALAFLILIGFTLVVEVSAFGVHIPKGYVYFAVFFSLVVEWVNIKIRKTKKHA